MAVEMCLHYLMENPTWVFIGAILACTGIFTINRLFGGPRTGRNPFTRDHRRPREALVTEVGGRDAVLKQSE